MNAVPRPTRRPLSVDDYHLMAEAGVFRPDERVELIEGWIVDVTEGEVTRHRQPGERGYAEVDAPDLTRPVALPTLGIDVDLSILFP